MVRALSSVREDSQHTAISWRISLGAFRKWQRHDLKKGIVFFTIYRVTPWTSLVFADVERSERVQYTPEQWVSLY